MLDALADGAGDLVVGPTAAAGLRVGSQIRGDESAGKIGEGQLLAYQFLAGKHRSAVLRPVPRSVATLATQ